MKKLLFTIATPEVIDGADVLLENHRQYAERNSYEYRVYSDRYNAFEFFRTNHPSFSKVPYCLDAIREEFDIIIYADLDVAFIQQGVDLANLVLNSNYWLAAYEQKNWDKFPYLCAGLIVIKQTTEARTFFTLWLDRCIKGCPRWGPDAGRPGEITLITWHPWEQVHFGVLLQEIEYKGVRKCTAQEIGCFSERLWNDGQIWRRGYPTVHFAGQGVSMADRAKLFKKYYAHLVC